MVQFGYRGTPVVDACWDAQVTSNETCPTKPPYVLVPIAHKQGVHGGCDCLMSHVPIAHKQGVHGGCD